MRIPSGVTTQQKQKINHDDKFYIWDESFLLKKWVDEVVRRCILECEVKNVFDSCHVNLYGVDHTKHKVLQYAFFWGPLNIKIILLIWRDVINANGWVLYQEVRNATMSNLEVEFYYVYGIDFVGPFMLCSGN